MKEAHLRSEKALSSEESKEARVLSLGLQYQTQAIWPQESKIIESYHLDPQASLNVLDIGCGSGLFEKEFIKCYPRASVTAIDLNSTLLSKAKKINRNCPNVSFQKCDAYHLPFADNSFDMVVCRHVLQSVQHPVTMISEMVRVLKIGGRIHLLAEDYGMIHASNGIYDIHDYERLFRVGVVSVFSSLHCHAHIGRQIPPLLISKKMSNIICRYVILDPIRVDRSCLVNIFEVWKKYFCQLSKSHPEFIFTHDQFDSYFDQLIAIVSNPMGYVVWQIPVISAIKTEQTKKFL